MQLFIIFSKKNANTMSQLVKTKRQSNFKDFKRFGAFKGLVDQKNVVFNSFLCKLGFFWHEWASLKREF
jgi:hypothetical protein